MSSLRGLSRRELIQQLLETPDAVSGDEILAGVLPEPHTFVVFDRIETGLDATDIAAATHVRGTGVSVVLAGALPPECAHIQDVVRLEARDLLLTEEEALEIAQRYGLSEALGTAIYVITRGWPEYFLACLRETANAGIASAAETFDHLHDGPHVRPLVDDCLVDLPTDDVEVLGKLSHFERVTGGMLSRLLNVGAMQRIERAGFPLVEQDSGWFEIMNPVRSRLQADYPLDEDTASSLMPVLVDDVGVVSAAQLMITAGQTEVAARSLRTIPVHKLDEGSQSDCLSILRTILGASKDDGALALRLARVLHNSGDLGGQREALEQASMAAVEQLRPDLRVEAQAELLLLDLPSVGRGEAEKRHADLALDATEFLSQVARIRLREIGVMISIERGDLVEIYRSIDSLNAVAKEWELLGESPRAAATLRLLTATSLVHLGRYSDGVSFMERACELSASHPQSLAKSVELLARITALAGDTEAFTDLHGRAARLLEGAGLLWAEGFLEWSAMVAAGFRGDQSRVKTHHRRAKSLLGALLEHETGVVFAAESAIAHAMVDEHDIAAQLLAEARERRNESPLEFGLAEVTLAGRTDDPDLQVFMNRVRATVDVPVERDWRIELEAKLADGHHADMSHLNELMQEATRHDLGTLFHAVVSSAGVDVRHDRVHVSVLGSLEARVGQTPIELPSGLVSEMVKILATHRRPVPVEVVIDLLWNDSVSTTVGTRRLKNVVNRARLHLGAEAVVRSEGCLMLGPRVATDVGEFRSMLPNTGVVETAADLHRAMVAIDLYVAPLLENDLYDDWKTAERQRLRVLALATLEQTLDFDSTPPAWALTAARRIGPEDEHLYLGILRLAERVNDSSTVRQCAVHATELCIELGVEPPPGLWSAPAAS